LGPSSNLQAGYNFLSLTTWKVTQRRSWVKLPMPGHVIGLINAKVDAERKVQPGQLVFALEQQRYIMLKRWMTLIHTLMRRRTRIPVCASMLLLTMISIPCTATATWAMILCLELKSQFIITTRIYKAVVYQSVGKAEGETRILD
jgi:hypothetical protein